MKSAVVGLFVFAQIWVCAIAMAQGDESILPPDVADAARKWRDTNLPPESPPSQEGYWNSLKELGRIVDESLAQKLADSPRGNLDEALTFMAYNVSRYPQRVDELRAWYAVPSSEISRELRGIEDDEKWELLQNYWNAYRGIMFERLKNKHCKSAYLPIWEAWFLAPKSSAGSKVKERADEAIRRINSPSSFSMLAGYFRWLLTGLRTETELGRLEVNKKRHEQLNHLYSFMMSNTDRLEFAANDRELVLLGLEWLRAARKYGVDEVGEFGGLRRALIRHFTCRMKYADQLECPAELAKLMAGGGKKEWIQEDLEQGVPPDGDRWRNFKPIIEETLKNPDGLGAEDVRFLEEAMSLMPNLPVEKKETEAERLERIYHDDTPLMRAAREGNTVEIKKLLKDGADVNVGNQEGATALTRAAGNGHVRIVELLLAGGADVNARDKSNGYTALIIASFARNADMVKLLLENGADVKAGEEDAGMTALNATVTAEDIELAKLFIEKGADVNAKDSNGETPLINAAWGGDVKMVKLLLEHGADVNVKDSKGNTPVEIARKERNEEMAEVLDKFILKK